MSANNRLVKIAGFARKYIEKAYKKRKDRKRLDRILYHADYRWQHTLRMTQFGKVIAETEGADVELVTAACLLHDLAWFDTGSENSREHGRIGAQIARPFLEGLGYTPDQVENICYSVATHVDVDLPDTLEARIVSDADNVDRFGPYRILQWCFADMDDYDRLADKLSQRINRLEQYRQKNPLFTATGKQLFSEQLDLQVKFFRAFVGEKELTVLPRI
jgi:putative nucleotidyltransferase with HDIG domain